MCVCTVACMCVSAAAVSSASQSATHSPPSEGPVLPPSPSLSPSPTSVLTHTDRTFFFSFFFLFSFFFFFFSEVLPLERGRGWLGRRSRSAVWQSPPARQRSGSVKKKTKKPHHTADTSTPQVGLRATWSNHARFWITDSSVANKTSTRPFLLELIHGISVCSVSRCAGASFASAKMN